MVKSIIRNVFINPTDEFRPERNSGEIITDPSGYMTTKQQIDAMRQAGARLHDWRVAHYDGDYDSRLDDFDDPSRSPNFDVADITELEQQSIYDLQRSKANESKSVDGSGVSAEKATQPLEEQGVVDAEKGNGL